MAWARLNARANGGCASKIAVLPPLLLGAFVIFLTQAGITHHIFGIKPLQLPLPLDVASAFLSNFDKILRHASVTLTPAVGGMLFGSLVGYCVAILVTRYPKGGYGSLFVMTAINSAPITALAPIMNRWFAGAFFAKLAVITVISMGAMAVNAFRGLNDLPPFSLDLMKSCAAPDMEIFLKLRFPASLPAVFTALKINVAVAMMGTIVSEYFASETAGIGYMIKYSLKIGNQKAVGWAYILAAAVLSLMIYAIIAAAQRRVVAWHVSQRLDYRITV
ncbi:MAG: ABC transporter permease subunit [Synergistaceae bacterium]|jgi:NitT/TauT family transport system permease protein|nr:ABC transporter permease subunit [Synergistaceae bacterium]